MDLWELRNVHKGIGAPLAGSSGHVGWSRRPASVWPCGLARRAEDVFGMEGRHHVCPRWDRDGPVAASGRFEQLSNGAQPRATGPQGALSEMRFVSCFLASWSRRGSLAVRRALAIGPVWYGLVTAAVVRLTPLVSTPMSP